MKKSSKVSIFETLDNKNYWSYEKIMQNKKVSKLSGKFKNLVRNWLNNL